MCLLRTETRLFLSSSSLRFLPDGPVFLFLFFCVLSSIRMISNKFMRHLQAYFLIGISLGN